ncbi:methionyl-tRNA formyltransferase [Patescibacteria group bacterium]|nr:methionyl-tRNA formyltransferase [Patescibacteria group bacterium]MBU4015263.1 methionyl-tRNA formyltransferase [Patescibacteria group bacterium]MBU4027200.1 methionyl-tRNA formyltransferase [Patescibacteria group bacterium]MBU4073379.1 methionyl-tRNA formyltransferase [Patescibacteria group bacterium]MBU4102978.1 methionyl-tRNA formyltransferase [Patescibacteria group bacterium]
MSYKNKKIKTIFIGTPDFAVPSLKALVKDDYFDVAGVITQPDKPVGRKQILTPPPVKVEAEKYRIPVFQPQRISNFKFQISNIDLIVVAAYAQLIPKEILSIPQYGCINVHGSLLPKYRGAAVIQAPILSGDKQTGITIIKMDAGLDTGPILSQAKIKIQQTDNAGSLYDKLSVIGAGLLIKILKKYINGEIKPMPQDEKKASYVGVLKKKDGKINWPKPAEEIERFVRAMTPWPSAFSEIGCRMSDVGNCLMLKIIEAEHEPIRINKYKIGELFLYGDKLAVQCGTDALIIKKLQLAGKKAMNGEEFLRGHNDFMGSILK